ncbi:hypothetical protein ACIOTI_13300 [Streptomyces sp. NPDC087843]|uniref:hypothetical protein n=1 Tax=Streptomyces sp. NPDC087843 TaxID=3365804 RepID=UPI003825F18A
MEVLLSLPPARGTVWDWASGRTLGCFSAAAIAAAVWVRVERLHRPPGGRFGGRRPARPRSPPLVPAAGSSGHHPAAESRFTLGFALAGGAFAPVAALPRFGVSGSLSDSASYRPSDAAGSPAPEPVRRP